MCIICHVVIIFTTTNQPTAKKKIDKQKMSFYLTIFHFSFNNSKKKSVNLADKKNEKNLN